MKLGRALLAKGMDPEDAGKLRRVLSGKRYRHVGTGARQERKAA